MIVLSCNKTYKSFGTIDILKDISFGIDEFSKVGLVGANGVGKSTLLKIIAKEIPADSGDIYLDKNKIVGYFSQNLDLNYENTILEEMNSVFIDLIKMEEKLEIMQKDLEKPYSKEHSKEHENLVLKYTDMYDKFISDGGFTFKGKIHKTLTGLNFSENEFSKNINILSGGEKTRVALAKLLLKNPDILILDEPTNHLDLNSIEWLENYLKDLKKTILVISHDRFFLDTFATHIYELEKGKMRIYKGNYSIYIDKRKKDFEMEMKEYMLNRKEIERQEAIIKKFKSFNREKSIRAAESREKALAKIKVVEKPKDNTNSAKIKFKTFTESGNDVFHIENLSKSFPPKLLFKNLNFDVKRGDRIAIIGDNGVGKTTLLKILNSKLNSDEGFVSIGTGVSPILYDQEQSDLTLTNTIFEEILEAYPYLTNTEIRSYLASFLFYGDDVFKSIDLLSGGEKCRINLLKVMLSGSNCLLLDEPTNHLDIMSRESLEDAILDYNGTIILISHDRYFLNKVAYKIMELTVSGANFYLGNYSYYVNKKENPTRYKELDEVYINKTKNKEIKKKEKNNEYLKREKEKKVKILEKEIETLETQLNELNQSLCNEEIYASYEKTKEINVSIEKCKNELDNKYIEWEELL